MTEPAEFQIQDDEAAQAAMVEQQVHAIPFVVKAQPALAADEGEVVAEFEQEGFELANEAVLQVGLGVFVAQAKEFEDERVADFLVGADGVAGLGLSAFGEHGGLVAREGGAFVELAVHLPLELAHGPAAAQGFGMIKRKRLGRPAAADEQNIMRPRQRKRAGEVGEVELCRRLHGGGLAGFGRRCRAFFCHLRLCRQCLRNLRLA